MPLILCFPSASEKDIGDMALEIEPFLPLIFSLLQISTESNYDKIKVSRERKCTEIAPTDVDIPQRLWKSNSGCEHGLVVSNVVL